MMKYNSLSLFMVSTLLLVGACGAANEKTESKSELDAKKFTWIEKGKTAVRLKLKDPDSAQFLSAEFHLGSSGIPAVCGIVNAKNSFGAKAGPQRFVAIGDLAYLESEVPNDFDGLYNPVCKL